MTAYQVDPGGVDPFDLRARRPSRGRSWSRRAKPPPDPPAGHRLRTHRRDGSRRAQGTPRAQKCLRRHARPIRALAAHQFGPISTTDRPPCLGVVGDVLADGPGSDDDQVVLARSRVPRLRRGRGVSDPRTPPWCAPRMPGARWRRPPTTPVARAPPAAAPRRPRTPRGPRAGRWPASPGRRGAPGPRRRARARPRSYCSPCGTTSWTRPIRGLRGIEGVAGQHPAHRVAPADPRREPGRRTAERQDAARAPRSVANLRRVGGDHDVGGERQLHAERQAGSLHGEHHRLRDRTSVHACQGWMPSSGTRSSPAGPIWADTSARSSPAVK